MKIGISTINDNNNYGNRLQNYAMQHILEARGHQVKTIKNSFNSEQFQKKIFLKQIKEAVVDGELLAKIGNKITAKKIKELDQLRFKNFQRFTDLKIKETLKSYNGCISDVSDLEEFDCFVIGSDQVWNYNFPRFSEFDFLSFSKKPKLAYAASFGVDSIPSNLIPIYSQGLAQIDYISVREEKGKEIVEFLTNKSAKVVLDPTLMLDKMDWLRLTEQKENETESFILTYFLDEPTSETKNYIKKIASENALSIKKLGDKKDKDMWIVDPIDFVHLFSKAEAIFTDSFHACVFSIIFEKYFEVFERNTKIPSMNSRIDTLFNYLKLEDRWHEGNDGMKNYDYSQAHALLKENKKISNDFLDYSLAQIEFKIKNNHI
ncbi:hypothetical protein DOK67_0001663 [Enterococcus sp. DIV0212c]|uniref:polysaccharide pyruvyl transferase family protein n=1 Tax=Enterococcus sp. DIV0212c TaxID=2230867 RepID=UPI001A9B8FB2|nr:polysaccharide pyruvyl transferase family protein [Enterococcus sp. DIV0212c]MBO1354131.1 polysaccharide pyruvyl transferase family protein [Enterococcus sp. DIV0212c]